MKRLCGAALILFVGCADGGGSRLDIQVAPLDLAGLDDVCYGLVVANGDGDTVWSASPLCASRYGNASGGDISYIGTCDASAPAHTVTLTVVSLVDDEGDPLTEGSDYIDPCPAGCVMPATCEENADTLVRFDLTVMRRAEQGFFDVAVDFEDVFCSGKVDCVDDAGAPLTLLHNRDGDRDQTVVVAMACTGGPGGASAIHMNDIRIVCGQGSALATATFPAFGACFDTPSGNVGASTVLLNGFAGQDPAYWRLLSQNTRGADWDPDVITVDPVLGGTTYDTATMFTRLGVTTGLAVFGNSGPGYVPTSETSGSLVDLALGVVTLSGDTWQAVTPVSLPMAAQFAFPDAFDGDHLLVQAVGPGFEYVVFPWDGAAFGTPAVVAAPADAPTLFQDAGHVLRNGTLLWGRYNLDGTVAVWAGHFANGFALQRLTVPETSVGAGTLHDGYTIAATSDFESVSLDHDGAVVVRVRATNSTNEEALVLGRFVQETGGWAFEIHPLETEVAATMIGATSYLFGDLRSYRDHSILTMAGGNPQQMIRALTDDRIYQRYDTTYGRATWLQQQSIIGIIERPGAPTLALFEFIREGESHFELELGVLGDETAINESGQLENLVTPWLSIDPGLAITGSSRLEMVARGADALLLTFASQTSAGTVRHTWRVDTTIPSATRVDITSSLGDIEPTFAPLDTFGQLEPGDMTMDLVPGGCDGVASVRGSQGFGGAIAALDFRAPATTYAAQTLALGAANDAIVASLGVATGEGYSVALVPSQTPGNQRVVSTIPTTDPVFQHAIYSGTESLDCDGQSCGKIYYDTAIGFDATRADCRLQWEVSASGGTGIGPDGTITPGAVYPVMIADVALTDGDGLVCTQHPLMSDDFAVHYSAPTASGLGFCYTWDGTTLTRHIGAGAACPTTLATLLADTPQK